MLGQLQIRHGSSWPLSHCWPHRATRPCPMTCPPPPPSPPSPWPRGQVRCMVARWLLIVLHYCPSTQGGDMSSAQNFETAKVRWGLKQLKIVNWIQLGRMALKLGILKNQTYKRIALQGCFWQLWRSEVMRLWPFLSVKQPPSLHRARLEQGAKDGSEIIWLEG